MSELIAVERLKEHQLAQLIEEQLARLANARQSAEAAHKEEMLELARDPTRDQEQLDLLESELESYSRAAGRLHAMQVKAAAGRTS